jgi:hypothetical protein
MTKDQQAHIIIMLDEIQYFTATQDEYAVLKLLKEIKQFVNDCTLRAHTIKRIYLLYPEPCDEMKDFGKYITLKTELPFSIEYGIKHLQKEYPNHSIKYIKSI